MNIHNIDLIKGVELPCYIQTEIRRFRDIEQRARDVRDQLDNLEARFEVKKDWLFEHGVEVDYTFGDTLA